MSIPSGKWGHASIEVPDFVSDLRGPLAEIIQVASTVLDAATQALNYSNAFTPTYIDPIAAIVTQLQAEVQGLIDDLGQLGFYVTGDWALELEDMRGGYAAFENRMLARLTDRDDPTRPDISSSTTASAIFLYLNATVENTQRLLAFLDSLRTFFNRAPDSVSPPMPVPKVKSISYGAATGTFQTLSDFFVSGQTAPNRVKITWDVPLAHVRDPFDPIPPIGPAGFLVTVSTLPEGIRLRYDRPVADTLKKGGKVKRENFELRDGLGNPIILRGGADQLRLAPEFSWEKTHDGSTIKDGAAFIYGTKDAEGKEIIPLELLKMPRLDSGAPFDASKVQSFANAPFYAFQRSFYVTQPAILPKWATTEYSITLDAKDLPLDADITTSTCTFKPASAFYVSIASVWEEVADKGLVYDMASANLHSTTAPFAKCLYNVSPSMVGTFSKPEKFQMPVGDTTEFLYAIQSALLVLALVRADYMTVDELATQKGEDFVSQNPNLFPIALRRSGLELFRPLLNQVSDLVPTLKSRDPLEWRSKLYKAIQRLAFEFWEKTNPPPDLQRAIIEYTTKIRTMGWGDLFPDEPFLDVPTAFRSIPLLTLINPNVDPRTQNALDALSSDPLFRNKPTFTLPSTFFEWGLAPNPLSFGLTIDTASDILRVATIRNRPPHFSDQAVEALTSVTFVETLKDAEEVIASAPAGLRAIYEKYRTPEGGIALPPGVANYVTDLVKTKADPGGVIDFPVFYSGFKGYGSLPYMRIHCARTLICEYQDGALIREAAFALGCLAAANLRNPRDGEWVAVRMFDSFIGISEFSATVGSWLTGLGASIADAGSAVNQLSSFLSARVREYQSLILRIDALLSQVILNFDIPSCSALVITGRGTNGLVQSFLNAESKPSDGPLSYGAGVVLVSSGVPSFLVDLFQVTETPQANSGLAPVLDVDSIPNNTGPAPSDPPEVL